MPPTTYYNSARLARAMKLHQSHVQRLIREGEIEGPSILLAGIGTRPPQFGYTLRQIERITKRWRLR